jgi:hypothetical protein
MNVWITILLIAIISLATIATAADRDPSPTTRPVVLVELFTSEGCSSCPPADALLAELSKPGALTDVTIIPLALHVDYWNRLGWTDPYSLSKFSERQERYAARFGRDQVYTPQMVVDGVTQFVGSNRAAAVEAITTAAEQPKGTIILRPAGALAPGAKTLTVNVAVTTLPPITKGDVADVIVALTEDDLSTSVTRGENAGHKLPHTAVVRDLQVAGVIDPTKPPLRFDRKGELPLKDGWRREKLKVIAFVQERHSGRTLAATMIADPHE